HIVTQERYDQLAVPEPFRAWVTRSWRRREPALYGRLDLCYDGQRPPKLLEYNADTPTSLLETAVAQWFWLEEARPGADQFNALHECLIERWQTLRRGPEPLPLQLHFAGIGESEEDFGTLEYLRDTAIQGGFTTYCLGIEQIGWNGRRFVDLEGRPIQALFKLYPWEWLVREAFGPLLLDDTLRAVEPPWKMLLSNKGLLAILWELFPGHPYLLPAAFEPTGVGDHYVKKPLLSREGANIEIYRPGQVLKTPGDYGAEGWVYQAYSPLPCFDGRNHVVVGSWVVGDRPAGIGLREDDSPITRDTSRFVPHYFDP
ncbi:MAG: glutathionylspermidine synthase family protein, partial [Candidatus Competibacteraceae bacterium]|nr:glutathionylspermidine synthase family protein [Candidatus Competibacteraceae bacterium]